MRGRLRYSLLLLGCGVLAWAGFALAGGSTVTLTSAGPQPAAVSVPWGGTVQFTNEDSVTYTVKVAGDTDTTPVAIPPAGSYQAVFGSRSGSRRYSVVGAKKRYHGTIDVGLSGQLTLEASTTSIVYGQKLTLHGRSTLGKMPIVVQSEPLDESRTFGGAKATWSSVTTVTPGADGSFVLELTPDAGIRYRATTAADQLRSADVHVHVTPAITARIAPRSSVMGRTIVAHARVLPAGAAKGAVLTRFVPSKKRWVPVASAPLQNGRATLRWRADRAGKLELRVELAPSGLGGGFQAATGAPVPVTIAWPPTELKVKAITQASTDGSAGTARLIPRELTAHPGEITLALENSDPGEHSIAIRGGGVDVKGPAVGQGDTSRVTVKLPAGKYTFYSPSDSPKAGLTGTLIVR